MLDFGKTPAVPMQSHLLTPCNTPTPSFSVQGWNKPSDVRLVSSSIPLIWLQHTPGLSHHLLDLFLLLHHWQLHGEGASGGGGRSERRRRKPQERSEAQDNSAPLRQSHSSENDPFFSSFTPKVPPPNRVFWCECQARLGCRAQLTDVQPTRAPPDRLHPAHPNLFSPQTTQHPTTPSHFRRSPQLPKALSFISHAKRAKRRVLIQHLPSEKRKKNSNPEAAFPRREEPGNCLKGSLAWQRVFTGNNRKIGVITAPRKYLFVWDKALRGESRQISLDPHNTLTI